MIIEASQKRYRSVLYRFTTVRRGALSLTPSHNEMRGSISPLPSVQTSQFVSFLPSQLHELAGCRSARLRAGRFRNTSYAGQSISCAVSFAARKVFVWPPSKLQADRRGLRVPPLLTLSPLSLSSDRGNVWLPGLRKRHSVPLGRRRATV